MNDIDTYGRWFQEFEQRNENSSVIMGFYRNRDDLETRIYPHARYDGISILLEYLAEQRVENFSDLVPKAVLRTPPGYYKQFKAFAGYLRNIRNTPKARKMLLSSNTWPEQPVKVDKSRLVWRVFDKKDTHNILLKAKHGNSSLNSYCLAKLLSSVTNIWADRENNIMVGIPISLHRSLDPGLFPRNRFSFIDIDINESHSAREINEIIQEKIVANKHYALWIGSHLPRVTGAWFYNYFLSVARFIQYRNILFSNVGVWCSNSDGAVFIIPPVLHYHPFSAGVITWGGKLAISMQIHPHLQINNNQLEQIIHLWAADLLESGTVSFWSSSISCPDPDFRNFGG